MFAFKEWYELVEEGFRASGRAIYSCQKGILINYDTFSCQELVINNNLSDLHVINLLFLERLYTEISHYICKNDLNI